MIIFDEFRARGHPNITARHRTTLEITKEDYLTKRGDCIIAIKSEKSVRDLDEEIKEAVRKGWHIALIIKTNDFVDYTIGVGDPMLTLDDPNRLIIRKSRYIDNKTLMIRANKAAVDLNRKLIEKLRREDALVNISVIGSDNLNELMGYIDSLIKNYLFNKGLGL